MLKRPINLINIVVIEPRSWSRWSSWFWSQRLFYSFRGAGAIFLLNLDWPCILRLRLLGLFRLRRRGIRIAMPWWVNQFIFFTITKAWKSLKMNIVMRRMFYFPITWRHVDTYLRFMLYPWLFPFLLMQLWILRHSLNWMSINFDRESSSFHSFDFRFLSNSKFTDHTFFDSAGTLLRYFSLMFAQNRVNLLHLIQSVSRIFYNHFVIVFALLGVLRVSCLSPRKIIIFNLQRSFPLLEACILMIYLNLVFLFITIRLYICSRLDFTGLGNLLRSPTLFSFDLWIFVPHACQTRGIVGLSRRRTSEGFTSSTRSKQRI